MLNAASAYQRLVTLALTLLGLLAPSYVHAALSHRTALPFPDRAQHAAQQNLTTHPSDHHLTSNPQHTRRVGARDVGKAAAVRRWVGASPAKRVEFVWDGEVLAFELDSETGPRAFVHEPRGFEPVLQQQGGETYLCVNDHLGMPKELIDGTGRLAWAAAHSAYGKVITTQGPGELEVEGGFVSGGEPRVESPFRLLGQVNDPDAELAWTRFRCFDAEVGTWISTDPLEFEGGLNLYAFDGSPSDVVDPLGLAVQRQGCSTLAKHLDYSERYGQGGVRELENGRIRYYGEVQPAKTAGEMQGRRYVHEFDPATGRTRGWHETVDHSGNVRQVRPELNNGTKTHYRFDGDGNYVGSW